MGGSRGGTWSVRGIARAMLPLLAVLTVVEVGSGLVLDAFEEQLLRYPSLLVLVPVTIGTAGNLGSILAARLSTAFHLGTLSFAPDDDRLLGNAAATVALALTVFPVVGVSAWLVTLATTGTELSPGTVVLVATMSGAALAVLAVVVTLIATYAAYRLRLDPDDVVIPVVTNTCDVLGVLVLFAVVRILI
ncbi:ABC transporter permease [Halostella sp. JP-L12]|uniref:magnesium transporter n=1 Tax=Halostella TaxID=1843185 RepID=UPI000EF7F58E|nr:MULTISPECIES: magnesium transporter [Halostella]NHN46384.1 ABC transporter permease [Halostella sp. JP-L12]